MQTEAGLMGTPVSSSGSPTNNPTALLFTPRARCITGLNSFRTPQLFLAGYLKMLTPREIFPKGKLPFSQTLSYQCFLEVIEINGNLIAARSCRICVEKRNYLKKEKELHR
jgi:hypothetical protein